MALQCGIFDRAEILVNRCIDEPVRNPARNKQILLRCQAQVAGCPAVAVPPVIDIDFFTVKRIALIRHARVAQYRSQIDFTLYPQIALAVNFDTRHDLQNRSQLIGKLLQSRVTDARILHRRHEAGGVRLDRTIQQRLIHHRCLIGFHTDEPNGISTHDIGATVIDLDIRIAVIAPGIQADNTASVAAADIQTCSFGQIYETIARGKADPTTILVGTGGTGHQSGSRPKADIVAGVQLDAAFPECGGIQKCVHLDRALVCCHYDGFRLNPVRCSHGNIPIARAVGLGFPESSEMRHQAGKVRRILHIHRHHATGSSSLPIQNRRTAQIDGAIGCRQNQGAVLGHCIRRRKIEPGTICRRDVTVRRAQAYGASIRRHLVAGKIERAPRHIQLRQVTQVDTVDCLHCNHTTAGSNTGIQVDTVTTERKPRRKTGCRIGRHGRSAGSRSRNIQVAGCTQGQVRTDR